MKTMISRIAAALLIALLATGLLVFALAESDANEPAPETGDDGGFSPHTRG